MTQDKKRVYVVELGDSLSKIAKEVYGDGSRWPEIFEANKDKISSPSRIYPGQELRIPYGPDDIAEPLPTEPPTEPPAEMPTPEELKPFVTVGSVDLFNGPSTDDEVVGTLSPGESLEIVGRNADSSWWQVATPDGLAWVAANVVTASHVDDRIPIVEAPSPPIQPTPIEPPPEPIEPPPPPPGEIVGESYGDYPVNTTPTDPPAEAHPDLNLTMRGYEPINARTYQRLQGAGGLWWRVRSQRAPVARPLR